MSCDDCKFKETCPEIYSYVAGYCNKYEEDD